MFKFFHNIKYSDDEKLIAGKARRLVMYGSSQAFKMFRDGEVRELLDFDNVEKVEQDRYFNEMVVTNIIMLMMILDQEVVASDPGARRDHLKALRAEAPKVYGKVLAEQGIEAQFLDIWKKLIDMRYDEYVNDAPEWRRAFTQVKKELGADNTIAIFQTLAYGLYQHLRRGQVEKDDPLYKRIQAFQVATYKDMRGKVG